MLWTQQTSEGYNVMWKHKEALVPSGDDLVRGSWNFSLGSKMFLNYIPSGGSWHSGKLLLTTVGLASEGST
jgi:hypothetical protein